MKNSDLPGHINRWRISTYLSMAGKWRQCWNQQRNLLEQYTCQWRFSNGDHDKQCNLRDHNNRDESSCYHDDHLCYAICDGERYQYLDLRGWQHYLYSYTN